MVVHLTSSHECYYENGFCSVFSDILYKNIIACMETMLCNYKCTSTLSFFGISEEKPDSVYTETMWCKFMCMEQTKRLCHSSTVYILCGSEISTSIVLMSVQPTSIRFKQLCGLGHNAVSEFPTYQGLVCRLVFGSADHFTWI